MCHLCRHDHPGGGSCSACADCPCRVRIGFDEHGVRRRYAVRRWWDGYDYVPREVEIVEEEL